jgi:putative transposase
LRGPRPVPLELEEPLLRELEALVRRHSTPQQIVLRARIVLLAQQGFNHQEIARQLDISLHMARHWRRRWLSFADVALSEVSVVHRLVDAPRPGAPATISAEAYCQIMALACQPPENCGRPITQWTQRELADEAIAQGLVPSISPRQVGRFLKRSRSEAAPQPLLADLGGRPRERPQDRSGLPTL